MRVPRRDVVRVSDHALLRFLERAGGYDVEGFRTTIETSLKRAITAANDIGSTDLIILADGLTYVVKNNVVVTILDAATMPLTRARPTP